MICVSDQVVQALGETFPVILAVVACIFRMRCALVHPLLELLIGKLRAADSQHIKIRIGAADARQVVERGDQLAPCQIAGSTKNYQQAGTCLR